jgi:hypothetical protein
MIKEEIELEREGLRGSLKSEQASARRRLRQWPKGATAPTEQSSGYQSDIFRETENDRAKHL